MHQPMLPHKLKKEKIQYIVRDIARFVSSHRLFLSLFLSTVTKNLDLPDSSFANVVNELKHDSELVVFDASPLQPAPHRPTCLEGLVNVPVPVWQKVEESIHALEDADGGAAATWGHCEVAAM